MAGASITLVRLDEELKDLLEAPAQIAAHVF
jgi:dihydroxyacetone kinase